MDVSAVSSILSTYQGLKTQGIDTDSSSLASKLTSRLLKNRDTDGDGYLTNTDLSELSSKEFSTLDTDGDEKLSTSEINAAFKAQMESIQAATKWGNRGALTALRKTASGKLMQAMRKAATTTTTSSSTSSSTSSTSSSSSSTTASSSSSSSLLDVTA